jgi:hypothetical protein
MVNNFTKDASFNNLVKDIKKLRIISFKSDKEDINRQKLTELTNNIHKESFNDMMQFSKDDYHVLIFAQNYHDKPIKFIGLGYDSRSFFIVDLVGNVSKSVITSILNGTFSISGINSVLNFTGPDNFSKGHKHKKSNGDDSGNK